MGLFSNLFGKKQDNEDNGLVLDLIDNGFVINDTRLQFPVRASELIKVLGTPRVVERACDDMLKKIYCEKYGFDINTYQPLIYYWDEFGLLAQTHDHETVHMFAISLHPSDYPLPMPRKMFTGTLLSHGKPWHDEVIKRQGGSLQYDKCYATVHSWGKYTKAKCIGHLEYKQKGDELNFFEITEDAKKILSVISAETVEQQIEVESEESDIYIMEKYWNHYIGDSDDSMSLIEYLAGKNSKKIRMKDVFAELGFDKADFDFRNPKEPITVSLKGGLEIDLHYAIQVMCDLAAILLECKKNGSVDLQELIGGMFEKDKVSISLSSTEAEEKVLLEVLADFCKSPMEYNLSEMCEIEEMEGMASVCNDLRNELLNL